MTGYRVWMALVLGVLTSALVGCGSLWSSPPLRTRIEEVAETRPAAAVSAPMGVAVAPADTVSAPTGAAIAPEGQPGGGQTPVTQAVPSPTSTAVRTLVATAEDAVLSLVVLHTNDTRGYLDPCG